MVAYSNRPDVKCSLNTTLLKSINSIRYYHKLTTLRETITEQTVEHVKKRISIMFTAYQFKPFFSLKNYLFN